jgi:hypothetical protein
MDYQSLKSIRKKCTIMDNTKIIVDRVFLIHLLDEVLQFRRKNIAAYKRKLYKRSSLIEKCLCEKLANNESRIS